MILYFVKPYNPGKSDASVVAQGSLQCLCLTGKGNMAKVTIKRGKVTNLSPVHQTGGL